MFFQRHVWRYVFLICIVLISIVGIVAYRAVFVVEALGGGAISFVIRPGENVTMLADDLAAAGTIRSAFLFRRYVVWHGVDRVLRAGSYSISRPTTIQHIVAVIRDHANTPDRTVTIIPGWDLRDIADYVEREKWGTKEDFFTLTGDPAIVAPFFSGQPPIGEFSALRDKPVTVSVEGYLAPETYRLRPNATLSDIIHTLLSERDQEITTTTYVAIKNTGHTVHEILTMASILEREVRSPEDRAMVADILWRRIDEGWRLQADSTVHYAVAKKGDVFTTAADRDNSSLWNTYQHTGLPPGPICSPSVGSIDAAIHPQKNSYWYFLTTPEGDVKYAKTLEEQNKNSWKYLR